MNHTHLARIPKALEPHLGCSCVLVLHLSTSTFPNSVDGIIINKGWESGYRCGFQLFLEANKIGWQKTL